ncbi:MAG: Hpt domain-containing protein [Bacteriovorax sp.]|nr:Hpt domain-containing protein [Rhizobacter sp.]
MTDPIIDLATFRELQDTAGPEFAAELVDTFLEEAPLMLAELRSARAEADADTFRRAAHSLKSNSQTFGAMALGALARELELKGLPGGGAEASAAQGEAALAALDVAYAQAAAGLKALCHG